MATPEKEYQRLPGRGVRRQGSWIAAIRTICTLWEGRDHLLCIDSMGGYAEDYKRFYYRDIQAIITRKTDGFAFGNVTFGILATALALIAWRVGDPAWRIFWFSLAGLCFVLLGVNWLRGPTCICHLRTAVQTEQLPSLRRLRIARKVIERLRPLIEQAQGTLSPDQLLAPGPPAAPDAAPAPIAVAKAAVPLGARPAGRPATAPPKPFTGRLHLLLCTLLLADAARIGVDFVVDNLWIAAVEVVLWCSIGLSLVMALIQQQNPGAARALRRWAWCVFGYVLSGFVIGYVNFILLSIRQDSAGGPLTEFDALRLYAQQSPFDSVWLMGTLLFCLLGSLGLGAVGLVLLHRARLPASPAAPPPPLRS